RLIRCVCGKKIGPDPRNFNQRVSLGRNDLLIRTFLNSLESLRDLSKFRSVPQRLMDLGLEVLSIEELWHWCEKLRSERGAEKIKCPSGIGINTLYPLGLVDEAIALYQKNVEARQRR
ncbi:hypothetical protein ACP72E_29135, partial [Klebsiella pneumoniae]